MKSKVIAILIGALVIIGGIGLSLFTQLTPSNITKDTTKPITLAEIQTHNSITSCWTAIEGNVYDVTSYVSEHPGGSEILKACGVDATTLFNNRPTTGSAHSAVARALLTNFQIGVLAQ